MTSSLTETDGKDEKKAAEHNQGMAMKDLFHDFSSWFGLDNTLAGILVVLSQVFLVWGISSVR